MNDEESARARIADLESTVQRLRAIIDAAPDALEAQYRRILETTSEGVWVIDVESRTSFANERMAAMLGYSVSEMMGRSMFDFMDDEGRRIATRNVDRRKAGIAEEHDFCFRKKDGSPVWTRIETSPIHGRDGSYEGALGMLTDVTARRAAEDASNRLLRILDSSLNEIYIFHPDTLRFEYANAGALRNLGYSLEQMRALTPLDLKPDLTKEAFAAQIEPLLRREAEKIVFTTTHRRADGSRYPVEVHLQLVAHAGGNAFVALINDITVRERAEAALHASEERFRALIERSTDVTLLLDREGCVTFVSPSVVEAVGKPAADVIGRPLGEIVHADDLPDVLSAVARLLDAPEGAERVLFRVTHAGGKLLTFEAILRNLLGVPAVRAIVMNSRDITEQRRLEAQYLQAQKLESIGRLAGGIAHDFNNVLTAILGYTELLEASQEGDAAVLEDLGEIHRAADRARRLTQQLLAFARRQIIAPRALSLNDLVREGQRLVQRLLGEHIDVSLHLAGEVWLVRVDASQIEQVILNLAINARDAMSGGGKLTIETSNVVLDEAYARTHPDVRPGPHVMLAVTDSGVGIPATALPHIFEPFFTTKGLREGTGLGLATVYGIVQQSGGHIHVYSEVGVGTTFKVYFPRTATDDAAPPPARPTTSRAGGTETVLVVEDDDLVRELSVRSLSEVGYRVLVAESPDVALRVLDEAGGEVQLLLTDVVMPGMSGKALADRVTAKYPHIRVIYVSGYTQNSIVHHGVLDPDVEFLAKPFTPTSLRERVRRVLDARRAP